MNSSSPTSQESVRTAGQTDRLLSSICLSDSRSDRVLVNQIPNIRQLHACSGFSVRICKRGEIGERFCGEVHQASLRSEGWRRCCGTKQNTSDDPHPSSLPTMAEDRQLPNIQEDCLLKVRFCKNKINSTTNYRIINFGRSYPPPEWGMRRCGEIVRQIPAPLVKEKNIQRNR